MKYRYITASCEPTDKICEFRLISHREINKGTNYPGKKIHRIKIPNDLQLEKWSCDTYATTKDTRTIEELGYDVIVIMWNGKRKIVPNGIDADVFAKEQNEKWTQALFQNPKEAYHPFESVETSSIKPLSERLAEALLAQTENK